MIKILDRLAKFIIWFGFGIGCFYIGRECSSQPMLTRVYKYKNGKMVSNETFVNDDLKYGCEKNEQHKWLLSTL